MSICHDLITINADCCLEVAQLSAFHLGERSLQCCEIGPGRQLTTLPARNC